MSQIRPLEPTAVWVVVDNVEPGWQHRAMLYVRRGLFGPIFGLLACSSEQVTTSDASSGASSGASAMSASASTEEPAPTTSATVETATSGASSGDTLTGGGDGTTTGVTTEATTDTGPVGPGCGDGQIDPGEECDAGANNGPGKACNGNCAVNVCGDGDKGPAEGCDDGNLADGDGCSSACELEACGDGQVQPGEECDDGNQSNSDDCTVKCGFPACGDGFIQPALGEACDDGNANEKDGCTTLCQLPACGDGIVHAGEQCDDGDKDNTDGCLDTCKYATCGDGFVHAGVEECDDANDVDSDACHSDCTASVCGDGVVQKGMEECDDGNAVADDGCDPSCGFSVVQLVAGEGSTCARFRSGKVRCWGFNAYGQLGLGHTNAMGDNPGEVPTPFVELGALALDLAAGTSSYCALVTGGKVRCWGEANSGILGYGNANNIGDQPGEMPPPDVPLGGPVVRLSGGSSSMCVETDSGAVRCWGNNGSGQLGYGNKNHIGDQPGEMPPPIVDLGGPVVSLGMGGAHLCAVMAQGKLRCWGNNASGQLGYGNTNNLGDQPGEMPPPLVDVGGPVVRVSTGYHVTCAVMESGKLRCWGDNKNDQLKLGNTSIKIGDQPGEMPPADFNIGNPAVTYQDARGDLSVMCARGYNPDIPGNFVGCWGSNLYSQVNGISFGDIFDAGGYHVCVRRENNPNVWCWGENGAGALALGKFGGTSTGINIPLF